MTINNKYENKNLESNDEINIAEFYAFLIRNKIRIFKFSVIGTFLFAFISFFIPKTWEGEFQILIKNDSRNSLLGKLPNNEALQNILSIGPQISLKTEVAILQSPMVLKNVYEYVKKEKIKVSNAYENLSFKDWQNNSLSIRLKPSTDIVEISYIDKDQEFILPILKKISQQYQDYSGDKRIRQINLSLDFVEDQIINFEKISSNSFAIAEQYAFDNNISLSAEMLKGNSSNEDLISNITDVEKIRIESFNKIRLIEGRLESFKNINPDNPEEIFYLASAIDDIKSNNLFMKIQDNKVSISRASFLFKEDDPKLKILIKERIHLLNTFKNEIIGKLNGQKEASIAKLNASKRPDEVLIKFKQLNRNAKRDKKTLLNLENQKRILMLEKAKNKDPWKLVTEPNLIDDEVSPNKKLITFFGLILGSSLGLLISYKKEKREDLIYSINQIQKLTNLEILKEIDYELDNKIQESLEILVNSFLKNKSKDTGILVIGDKENINFKEIFEYFNKKRKIQNLQISENVSDLANCSEILILICIGISTYSNLIDKHSKVLLQNNKLLGLLVIKPRNSKSLTKN